MELIPHRHDVQAGSVKSATTYGVISTA